MGPRVCRVRVPALRRVLGTHAAAQVGHVTRVPAHALRHHPVPGRRVLQVAVPPLPLVHVPPVGHAHGAVYAWTHLARVTLFGSGQEAHLDSPWSRCCTAWGPLYSPRILLGSDNTSHCNFIFYFIVSCC